MTTPNGDAGHDERRDQQGERPEHRAASSARRKKRTMKRGKTKRV